MRGKGHTTQTERTKGAKDDILVFRVDPIYRNIFAERVRYMACRLTSDISEKMLTTSDQVQDEVTNLKTLISLNILLVIGNNYNFQNLNKHIII